MASSHDREVIKEFLVSLGFVVDKTGLRNFTGTLGSLGKTAAAVGGSITAVATAAEAMVQKFGTQFERLYYASQRTGATVQNIRALEFAAGQVGLTAEQVEGALESLALYVKRNPGGGLLAALGIKTEGNKNILDDTINALKKFPNYLQDIYAGQLGLDSQMLFQLTANLEKFRESEQKSKFLDQLAGFDEKKVQQLTADFKDFKNESRELWHDLDLLYETTAVDLMPAFQNFHGVLREMIVEDILSTEGPIAMLKSVVWAFATGVKGLSNAIYGKPIADMFKSESEQKVEDLYGNRRSVSGKISGLSGPSGEMHGGVHAMLERIEKAHGIPAGSIGRMIGLESGWGRNMGPSSAGAVGWLGFLPKTAKQYGVNPYDLASSAEGAGQFLEDLMQRHGGNFAAALAGYNWSEDKLNKYGLGAAPAETRKYIDTVMGAGTFSQQTNITVNGSTDPGTTAKAIGAEQRRVNGDLVRNMGSILH